MWPCKHAAEARSTLSEGAVTHARLAAAAAQMRDMISQLAGAWEGLQGRGASFVAFCDELLDTRTKIRPEMLDANRDLLRRCGLPNALPDQSLVGPKLLHHAVPDQSCWPAICPAGPKLLAHAAPDQSRCAQRPVGPKLPDQSCRTAQRPAGPKLLTHALPALPAAPNALPDQSC